MPEAYNYGTFSQVGLAPSSVLIMLPKFPPKGLAAPRAPKFLLPLPRKATLTAAFFIFCLFSPCVHAQIKPVRRVLVFYELGLASPGISAVDQQMRLALESSPYQIELYREYLETTLFPDPATQQEFRDWYIHKYRDRRPDIIIAVGPSALKFIVDSHEKFFKDIPTVFGATEKQAADNPKLDSHFTGIWEKLEPQKTLEAALRLLPGTRHVVVVGGMSSYDRHVEAIFKERLHSYESKLDVTYLTDLAMPTLLERLKQLPPHTVVLYSSLSQDSRGTRYIAATQAAPMIVAAANGPVFSSSETELGHGEVGGCVDSFSTQGKIIGTMALKLINGEKAQDIPIVHGANAYIFDWRALRRWRLDEKGLPAESLILNRQPTLWESYRWYILAGLVVLLTQLAIIVTLFSQWLRRRKVQEALARANDQLYLALDAAKAACWHMDLKKGVTTWSGGLQNIFGIPEEVFSVQAGGFLRYLSPEDQRRVMAAIEDAQKNREPYAGEFRVVRPDGTILWVAARGKFDYFPDGETSSMTGLAIDVTERKQIEESLKKSEEKFAKAFRESPVSMSLTRIRDHSYLEVNGTFERTTGWTREEVVGRSPLELGIWVEPSQRTDAVTRLLSEGSIHDFDISFRRKDGQLRTGVGSLELLEVNGEPCALSVILDVTEAKQAEQARLLSEMRFSQFFQTLPEYCYLVSPTGEIQEANSAACAALGYTREELIGKPLSFIYAPECQHRMAELFEKWRTTGTLRNEELVILSKAGKAHTVLVNAGAVKDSSGKIIHSASIQVDITDYREVRQKLEESERRLESIVASAMDAIIAIDSKQRVVVFNAAAEAMFGCRAEEALLATIDRFIPARFRTAHVEHIERFGATGITNRGMGALGTLWGLRADAEEFPIEASISQTGSADNKLYTVIIRDVTQRRRAEQAVRESEERFRLLANTAPVMIWTSGPDKLCTFVNQTWLDFTGRTFEQEMGNGWTEGVHPDDLERCLNTYTQALHQRSSFRIEYRIRQRDGEYRWIDDLGVPRLNPDGSFAGYIGSCLDVTERKQAEEVTASMSRRLIEAHEEERTRVARELHDDINQRVAFLAVSLDVAKHDLPSDVTETKRRITEIKEQLIDLGSDIQAMSHRLHSSKLEYLGLAAAAAAFCRDTSARYDVQIDFEGEEIPRELASETSLCLFRVLQETVQNALKHSGSKNLEVSLRSTSDTIVLTVQDWGLGFDVEEALKGQGLGITSMRERLKLVNGELFIQSANQKGTSVRAIIPLNSAGKSARVGH